MTDAVKRTDSKPKERQGREWMQNTTKTDRRLKRERKRDAARWRVLESVSAAYCGRDSVPAIHDLPPITGSLSRVGLIRRRKRRNPVNAETVDSGMKRVPN